VVNDVRIPEYIGSVLYSVYPVTGKIKCHKGNEISEQAFTYLHHGKFIFHPAITDDGHAESQHIFGHIGYT